ncbi:transcriptional regulator, XRE family [Methylobacterium sp. 190mf]|uniref:helix-turn-helix domain-containing protein n=1 Tax=Methylobacterium sp. 190mf TaxID=1761798 RepID=UPI00089E383A|nr:helix-turn-helix transcriptional regulator [Methylobacterium sp. 190mf]SEG69655.1 transcriptional regulator, XRE family [Methylobacterium sp. 190mf]
MAIPFKTVRDRWNADPEYRAAHAEVSPEMELAFAMAEARHRANLSQAEVARRIGTSQAMVARWENGKVAPTTTSLRRYAEATGALLRIQLGGERVREECLA